MGRRGPGRRGGIRQAHCARQQRRDRRAGSDRQVRYGQVAEGHRRQPDRNLPRHAGRRRADEGGGRRLDHQRLVDRGTAGRADGAPIRRLEVGGPRPGQVGGDRTGLEEHPGQLDPPGLHSYPDDQALSRRHGHRATAPSRAVRRGLAVRGVPGQRRVVVRNRCRVRNGRWAGHRRSAQDFPWGNSRPPDRNRRRCRLQTCTRSTRPPSRWCAASGVRREPAADESGAPGQGRAVRGRAVRAPRRVDPRRRRGSPTRCSACTRRSSRPA